VCRFADAAVAIAFDRITSDTEGKDGIVKFQLKRRAVLAVLGRHQRRFADGLRQLPAAPTARQRIGRHCHR
jgi:hypothetical protein